ncbi:MAG: transcription elongation factor GreA [Minisyncoccia bacterium]|jgi:transcription elongation factor GreA
MATQQYLSQERFDELTAELAELKTAKRIEIAQRLKNAKEYGDLSENSEYAEAREEQAAVETRINELEDLLKNAAIMQKTTGGDMVAVGSTVVVKKAGKETTYQIVGSYDADPAAGKISDESPLGKAFMKKRVGDKVNVATPGGTTTYEIMKIE